MVKYPMFRQSLTIALAVCFVPAFASTDRLQVEWQKRYDLLSNMVRQKNLKAVSDFIAEDCVWFSQDGSKENKQGMLRSIEAEKKLKSITGGITVESVIKEGKGYKVNWVNHWTFVTADGKSLRSHLHGIDTWRHEKGKWKIIESKYIPTK